jgi:hypothetical protein
MEDREQRLSRRKFIAASAFAGLSLTAADDPAQAGVEAPPLSRTRPARLSIAGRKPIAVLTTVYRPLSHSYHIGGRFIHGYARGDKLHVPRHHVASLYAHQAPDNDPSK